MHLTVADDPCFGTHGISIGSETTYGLWRILVAHNLIEGRDPYGTESSIAAGIRIKSYAGVGGLVQDVAYVDTTMADLQYPIDLDPFYSAPSGATAIPDYAGITIDGLVATHSVPGAQEVVEGYSADDPTVLTLRDVHVDATDTVSQYARITVDHSDLSFAGEGVAEALG